MSEKIGTCVPCRYKSDRYCPGCAPGDCAYQYDCCEGTTSHTYDCVRGRRDRMHLDHSVRVGAQMSTWEGNIIEGMLSPEDLALPQRTAIDPHNLPPRVAVRAALMRRSFKRFVQEAWGQIDTRPLIWNMAAEAICIALQAVADGRIKKLLINIPPGLAKSMLTSVLFPAWVWARDPRKQFLNAAYEVGLPTRDAVKMRTLVDSKWYREHFRGGIYGWDFVKDQNAKTYYMNDLGGTRQALGVGGKATGYRGDCIIIDDPQNALEAYSEVARETAKQWFKETMPTRLNDQVRAWRIMIQQRLHEDDLSATALKDGYTHLSLQMVYEKKFHCTLKDDRGTVLWTDPRSREGDLLFEAMFPPSVLFGEGGTHNGPIVGGLRKSLGSFGWSAQMQQQPIPGEGGYIKRDWFRKRWIVPGTAAFEGFMCRPFPTDRQPDAFHLYGDCAFKKLEDNDRVALGVFAVFYPDIYLVGLKWDRMSFTETISAIEFLLKAWPQVSRIGIEDKANGTAVIEVMSKRFPGFVAIEPEGGKESRIMAAAPYIEAGNVWLACDPKHDDLVNEAAAFPKGAHDDGIDMLSYAVNQMLGKGSFWALDALAKK